MNRPAELSVVSTEWAGGGVGRLMTETVDAIRRSGIPVETTTVGRGPLRLSAQAAAALVPRRRKAPVLYANWYAAAWSELPLRRRLEPTACLIHGAELFALDGSTSYGRVGRRILLQTGTLVAVSHYTRDQLVQGGVPPGRVHVVEPGVALRSTNGSVASTRSGGGRSTVTTIGRIVARKNHALMLRALATLSPAERPLWHVIGDGPLRPRLETLAAELGVGTDVRFHGEVDDITCASLLSSSAAHVLLSRAPRNDPWDFEGFGLVHLEARAFGVPSIALAGCGAEDAVVDGVTGVLLPLTASPEDVAAALVNLIGDVDGWRIRVRSRPPRSWDDFARDIVSVVGCSTGLQAHGNET